MSTKPDLLFSSSRYSSHKKQPSSNGDLEIYELVDDLEKRIAELERVAASTGFPISFSERATAASKDGFVSVRTSAEAIPRGSFAIADEDGQIVILADYKTTGVGSKSKLRGMGKGKLLLDRAFWDKGREESKVNDPKDNNSLSKFPDRKSDEIKEQLYVNNLNEQFIANGILKEKDIQEVRIYNGLIYFSLNVPEYDSKNSSFLGKKQPKHYCQEAETIASILFNLDNALYTAARIEKEFLYFNDENGNCCRIDLRALILPAELGKDEDFVAVVSELASAVKDLPSLKKYVEANDQRLQFCHAPIFTSRNPKDLGSFIPVMVQTGDNGESIIRDSDFEHFYKHPLIPPMALKTFNGGNQPTSSFDHMDGLKLLQIRLNSTNIDDFKKQLASFIENYIAKRAYAPDKGTITLDDYTVSQLKKIHHGFPSVENNKYKLSELDPEMQAIVMLAKYNDITTLANGTPFIDYSGEGFSTYREAVDLAYDHYSTNEQALKNLGESSMHDMVFLFQLGHPMASHGDEGNHPKGKPEDFSRITTYCNQRVLVTSSEDQYLRLLFTNPEMLQKQTISIHPYWLIGLKSDESSPEYKRSAAWVDLLCIQALRHVLEVQENKPGADIGKSFDVFVQSVLLNMPRRYLKGDDEKNINELRDKLAARFEGLRQEVSSMNTEAILSKITQIYESSVFNIKTEDSEKYRVYAPIGHSSSAGLAVKS